MFRLACVATLLSIAVLAACDNGGGIAPAPTDLPSADGGATIVPATPVAKPETVPKTAQPIGQTATLGRIMRRANQAPQVVMPRRLLDATCQDEVMVIDTSEETIYAALPCDRFWDDRTKETFLDEESAIVLEVTEARFRVLIETVAGAQAEFTVVGIWVE